jgi:sarcosine oxidase
VGSGPFSDVVLIRLLRVETYDLVVIGVGGMGSAIVAHAAGRNLRVLGIEQFSIPNIRGSSHGATRILRLGLHEGPTYVPLVLRAVELWQELGEKIGTPLFHQCGGLDIARPDSPIFRGSKGACEKFQIAHEILDAAETTRRFPAVRTGRDMLAVFQPGSGFVLPELAITAHVNLALERGAEIHGHERVLEWEPKGGRHLIHTDRATYEARQVIFSAGAWMGKLLAKQNVPVVPERTVLGWFAPKANAVDFQPGRLPIWIIDAPEIGHFYGFPIHGIPGFKLGRLREIPSPAIDPDLPRREPDHEDEKDMRRFIQAFFPDADGPVLSMETCFFENSPDRAPIIDRVPGTDGAWIVGGFSGHGFKFCSAVGEVMSDLITTGSTSFDLSPFRFSRFTPPI